MCTAIHDHNYFGRTLDLEISYGEKIAIVPRGYEFNISGETIKNPNAIIGVANLADGYPLFYDAINERGLGVAALNFPGNAAYFEPIAGKHNVSSYELIPWLLATCDSINSAVSLLGDTVITNVAFSNKLKPTPLHWIIADRTGAITVEQTVTGLNIYDNPLGVMTNNPPFPYHLNRITDYLSLDSHPRVNRLCPDINLEQYSRGMGGIGLPGDYSSCSRFVRAVFLKNHTTGYGDPIGRLFHIMDTVSIPNGAVKTNDGADVRTVYTSVADMNNIAYYFTTYNSRRIRGVKLTEKFKRADCIAVFNMNCDMEYEQIDYLE